MEFFINDPKILRYPPAGTHLLDLIVIPDADGKRVKVNLELTPFLQRPDIELSLVDSDENEVVSASIIEPVDWRLDLNLHIRKTSLSLGRYTLLAGLIYPELGEVDRRVIMIDIPLPSV
jgi:hypothetical protein